MNDHTFSVKVGLGDLEVRESDETQPSLSGCEEQMMNDDRVFDPPLI